jgi:hypothetical protein
MTGYADILQRIGVLNGIVKEEKCLWNTHTTFSYIIIKNDSTMFIFELSFFHQIQFEILINQAHELSMVWKFILNKLNKAVWDIKHKENIFTFCINKPLIKVRGNHKWTIQRNWQHRVHKTNKNKTKTI